MSTSRSGRRSATVVVAIIGALMLTLGPTAAHAAGWGTIAERNHGDTALAKNKFHSLKVDFTAKAGQKHRICVQVKGNGSAYIQPIGTKITINTSSWVTRCTAAVTAKKGTGYGPLIWLESGDMKLRKATVQRYYTGMVPV